MGSEFEIGRRRTLFSIGKGRQPAEAMIFSQTGSIAAVVHTVLAPYATLFL